MGEGEEEEDDGTEMVFRGGGNVFAETPNVQILDRASEEELGEEDEDREADEEQVGGRRGFLFGPSQSLFLSFSSRAGNGELTELDESLSN